MKINDELYKLTAAYKKHLDSNHSDPKVAKKLKHVTALLNIIKQDGNSPAQLSANITQFKDYALKQQDILKERRNNSPGARFWENIINVLTVGLYSYFSKGIWGSSKTHGEVFTDKITEELNKSKGPKLK